MRVLLHLVFGLALTIGHARAQSQPSPPPADDEPAAKDAAGGDEADDGTSKGTLVVTARSQKGGAVANVAVTIDNKPMGELDDGALTLTNIPEGRHAIVLEARGYQKLEQSVMVHEGQRAKLEALLVAEVPPPKPKLWKWTLGASVPMIVIGLGYGYHSHTRAFANRDAIVVTPAPNPDGGFYADPKPIQTNDCGKDAARLAFVRHSVVANQDRLDRMCMWRDRSFIAYGFAGVGLIGAFISIYMLTMDRRADPLAPVAIVPTVTPDGAGAQLSIVW